MKLFSFLILWLLPHFLSAASAHAVILAGGGGTRLWPQSRDAFPKQFLDFGTGESLLQQTIARLLQFHDLEQIVISTNARYEALVRSQIEKFQNQSHFTILVEPSRKNTAPAIAFAMKYLSDIAKISSDTPVLVVPADHTIDPVDEWVRSIENVFPAVELGHIVLFGIHPTKPETGYGYLEMGSPDNHHTYKVSRFIEKPNREKAESLIQSNRIYWNSGIFSFSSRTFWDQIRIHSPEIFRLSSGTFKEMEQNFSQMPDISIDYAIMEKSDQILASPLHVNWSDIGSWDGLYEILKKDANGNVLQGKVASLETKNSLIFSQKRIIATIGLEDLLIVETEDALLIAKRGDSQKIKSILQEIQKFD